MAVLPTGNQKLLNISKKYCVPESVGHFEKHCGHYCYYREGWEIPNEILTKAKIELNDNEVARRARIARQPKLFRLIQILRKLFQSNQAAKNCIKRSTRSNAYSRKNSALIQAVELAKKISLPFFSWGIQLDPATPGYEIVVYFQFGSDAHHQVSFHTDYIPPCPEFKGKWNGIIASRFPISVPLMRKILKVQGFSLSQLREMESKEDLDPPEEIDLNDEVNERKSSRFCNSFYNHRYDYGFSRYDWDDDFIDDDYELRDYDY